MAIQQQSVSWSTDNMLSDTTFDVVVVGAGVVGCAMARRFALEGATVAIVEKATDILDGASKANSAILHTGFDAPSGSVELECICQGYREYSKIHSEMGLPFEKIGAHVVAWNEAEAEKLGELKQTALDNGVDDVRLVDSSELSAREPHLDSSALAALWVPSEAIIDPWSAPYAYLRQSLMNGAEIFTRCEVKSGEFDGEKWQLDTNRGRLRGRYVINCAGLFGDLLDQALIGSSAFNIAPRKGQFVIFDKAARSLVNTIILPVPNKQTKGVVVCPTIFGNILVGPTAEEQDSRSDSSTDARTLEELVSAGVGRIPALRDMPVTAVYAGIRPATQVKNYHIHNEPEKNWITVGGIRSTGLSSALGIARHVFALYRKLGNGHDSIKKPRTPQATVLAQSGQRDWQKAGHGDIVCHCEHVTEREISEAMSGPLAARSLAGLKRQTRATMGRCQGFYCMARLAKMSEDQFDTPLAEAMHHG